MHRRSITDALHWRHKTVFCLYIRHEGVFKTNKDCEQVTGSFILSPLSLRPSLFLHIQSDVINEWVKMYSPQKNLPSLLFSAPLPRSPAPPFPRYPPAPSPRRCFVFSGVPRTKTRFKMAVDTVKIEADAYMVCLTHALSTEREEVMGLLIGEVQYLFTRFIWKIFRGSWR